MVAHVKNYGVDADSRVELYLPFLQYSSGAFTLVVRTQGDPAALTSSVRAAVRAADPELPSTPRAPSTSWSPSAPRSGGWPCC